MKFIYKEITTENDAQTKKAKEPLRIHDPEHDESVLKLISEGKMLKYVKGNMETLNDLFRNPKEAKAKINFRLDVPIVYDPRLEDGVVEYEFY